MAILNINSNACAYGDATVNANPKRRYFDWQRNNNGISVTNPKVEQYVVPARQMLSLFSGVRATTVASNTAFSLTFMADSRYRFAYTGGTDPGLATNVALSFVGITFNVIVNANSSMSITATTSTPFTGVSAGQTLYIYGTDDGVTGAFNPQNAGIWKILSASTTSLVVTRYPGTTFDGVSETVTCSATNNMLVYVMGTVQIGDNVSIASGFQTEARNTYTVTGLTSKWFEIVSAQPLANETGILPTATGIAFYSQSKRFIRLEVDQESKVYFNGSIDENQIISPWVAGDEEQVGWVERCGPTWSANVYNRSISPMTVTLFSVE